MVAWGGANTYSFAIRGTLLPGSLTLILAAPGGGKTALLSSIAAVPRPRSQRLLGAVTYAGFNSQQLAASGVHLRRMIAYAPQTDVHVPQLTVRETLAFVADSMLPAAVPASWMLDPPPGTTHVTRDQYVGEIVAQLGLTSCLDTIMGSDDTRGVSGGQRKRVTIAEALIPPARVLALDEITSGLDAAVAYDVIRFIRDRAMRQRVTVVAALQQPTADIMALFDQVLCLRHGCLDAAGSVDSVAAKYRSYGGGTKPDRLDDADWIVRCLHELPSDSMPVSFAPAAPLSVLPAVDLASPAWAHYRVAYTHAAWWHGTLLLRRQAALTYRNVTFLAAHVAQAVVVGAILGSLFRDPAFTAFYLKLSAIVFGTFVLAFANMPEVGITVDLQRIVTKQVRMGMYHPATFALAQAAVHFPIALVESIVLGSFTYWMIKFDPAASRYVFFLFTYLLLDLVNASMFRLVAFASPAAEVAQTVVAPLCGVLILHEGFLVTSGQIPGWLIWVYWLSPFSWAFRSLAQNEFLPADSQYSVFAPFTGYTYADIYMAQYEITTDSGYKWGGIIYLACVLLLLQVAITVVLSQARGLTALGTSRQPGAALPLLAEGSQNGAVSSKQAQHDAIEVASLPPMTEPASPPAAGATDMTLAFDGIGYTVALPVVSTTVPEGMVRRAAIATAHWIIRASPRLATMLRLPVHHRTIVADISASAAAGTMTAICGVTGSGKTTLLDVIAGIKTTGAVRGSLRVNGSLVQPRDMALLAGYVQQSDIHLPHATVREAVTFSARLRGPPSTAAATDAYVTKVLEAVELLSVADRLIGDESHGLSTSQRKKLTIAVELAARSRILLLDEPTTGLDSRSAAHLILLLQRLTRQQRLTVLCTIHQPSADMFCAFDQVLALDGNGRQAYFGPIGAHGRDMETFFVQQCGVQAMTPSDNPATWLLKILSGGHAAAGTTLSSPTGDLKPVAATAAARSVSEMWATSAAAASTPAPDTVASSPALQDHAAAVHKLRRSFITQLTVVTGRVWRAYYRDVAYNGARVAVFTLLAILFGALYYRLDTSVTGGIVSSLSMHMIALGFCGMIHFASILQVMVVQRAVMYREVRSAFYSAPAHTLAHLLVEIPYVAALTLLFTAIFYNMVQATKPGAQAFFHFFLVLWVMSQAYNAFGLWFAGLMPTVVSAQSVGYFIQALLFLFSGLFIPRFSIPSDAVWLYSINILHYACDAVWTLQYYCANSFLFGSCPTFRIPPTPFQSPTWDFVRDLLGLTPGVEWWYIGVLAAFYAGFAMLAVLTYTFVSHVRR